MSSSFPYNPTIPQSDGSIILDDMSTCKLFYKDINGQTVKSNNTITTTYGGPYYFMMLNDDEYNNMVNDGNTISSLSLNVEVYTKNSDTVLAFQFDKEDYSTEWVLIRFTVTINNQQQTVWYRSSKGVIFYSEYPEIRFNNTDFGLSNTDTFNGWSIIITVTDFEVKIGK